MRVAAPASVHRLPVSRRLLDGSADSWSASGSLTIRVRGRSCNTRTAAFSSVRATGPAGACKFLRSLQEPKVVEGGSLLSRADARPGVVWRSWPSSPASAGVGGRGQCGQATKGMWGMSWRQEAMKGVEDCDNPGGAVNRALRPGSLNYCTTESIGRARPTRGTETSQYPEERKAKATPSVAASERGPSPNPPDSSGGGCRTGIWELPNFLPAEAFWKVRP